VPRHHLSPEAVATFAAAAWPGNVRQLIHELERAVVASEGLEIGVDHLSPDLQTLASSLGSLAAARGRSGRSPHLDLSGEPSPGAAAGDVPGTGTFLERGRGAPGLANPPPHRHRPTPRSMLSSGSWPASTRRVSRPPAWCRPRSVDTG